LLIPRISNTSRFWLYQYIGISTYRSI